MRKATYRTIVHDDDWAHVETRARRAAEPLTIVDHAEAYRVTAGITEVVVEFQALNENEAKATAHVIHTALAHFAPTDQGTVTL